MTRPVAASAAYRAGMSDAKDDEAQGFDQTNGLAGNLEGEAGGTAEGDEESRGDRDADAHPRPVGAQDTFAADHYGEDEGRDPNP